MKKRLFNNTNNESGFKERFMKLLNKEGFYVAIFLCITLIATAVVFITNNRVDEDLAQNNDTNEISESVNIEEDSTDVSKIIDDTEKNNTEGKDNSVKENVPKEDTEPEDDITIEEESSPNKENNTNNTADPLKNIVNPVNSKDVVMAFSYGTKPVYSNTLKEFRSDHTGIDLKAELGQDVKAALDGKVIKIYSDGKLGKTIVLQHSGNVETRYSNLDENISVTLNQAVKTGQNIAKVGKTATFEAEDEPHLHFEIWKDGKCIDPQPYIK